MNEEVRWWNAMRKLRTLRVFERKDDSELIELAEATSSLSPGEAKTKHLEVLYQRGATSSRSKGVGDAGVPYRLVRSEMVTELCKFEEHQGLSRLQVERLVPRRHLTSVATVTEVGAFLKFLGGSSSSSPETAYLSAFESFEVLKGTNRFRGLNNAEVYGVLWGMGLGGPKDYDRIARGFKFWEGGDSAPPPRMNPEEFLGRLRKDPKLEGLTAQEAIDRMEEETSGPASFGGKAKEPGVGASWSPGPRTEGRAWWNALRKVRTLAVHLDEEDTTVVAAVGRWAETEDVTADDIHRYYEDARERASSYGVARIGLDLTRREMLSELSKFERYEGMTLEVIEEMVPGLGTLASSPEIKKHLDDLGGPSTRSPEKESGWWNAMRDLRTLACYKDFEDEGLVDEVEFFTSEGEVTEERIRWLFDKDRRIRVMMWHSKIPWRLTEEQTFAELAKMPRYEGMTQEEIEEEVPVSDPRKFLDFLGGPSSSW